MQGSLYLKTQNESSISKAMFPLSTWTLWAIWFTEENKRNVKKNVRSFVKLNVRMPSL